MNGVLSSGEMIFGHQISCLVLIHHTCKTDEDQGQLSQMIEKDRREVIALLLDLLQKEQLDYAALLKQLNRIGNENLVYAFDERMHELVKDKYVKLMDFFDSLEPFTLSGNNYLERSSLFGIFVRKMYLKYQKMNFNQTGRLGKLLESYMNIPKVEESRWSGARELLGDSIVCSMEVEGDTCQTDKDVEINSLSQVERFISQQAKLLECESTSTLSPKKLQEKINEVLRKFPDAVDAYYLSYLNQLQVGEVRNALFDLHRYFDYQKWDEEQVDSEGDADKASIEKYQMKFKRFRYCALNLGILHCFLGNEASALAAMEEAVEMAQITHDNHCLLQSLFWLYRLTSVSDPVHSKSLLEQFNKRAKALGYSQMESLGILIQCRLDAFSGNAAFEDIQSRLNTIDSMEANKSEVSARQMQVGRSALLDFFGFRAVACHASQVALCETERSADNSSSPGSMLSLGSQNPKSTILALCQTSSFLADEGLVPEALDVVRFGTSLISEHSNDQQWLSLCKWQIIFNRSLLKRDLVTARQAIGEIRPLDRHDANLKQCQVSYLSGNFTETASKLEEILEVVEKNADVTIGNTPSGLYRVRVLQLKAELLASSKELPRAIDCLLQCMDLCRKYKMKSVEAEISICLAQCKILLGLAQQSKNILNKQMIQILSHGTLYVRSLAFLVLAKASLFCIKGELRDSKSELLSLLPTLQKTLSGFQSVNADAQQCETLQIMAHIYNILEYTTERNRCAHELKLKMETLPYHRPVKLFL